MPPPFLAGGNDIRQFCIDLAAMHSFLFSMIPAHFITGSRHLIPNSQHGQIALFVFENAMQGTVILLCLRLASALEMS